jgi:hypothetical protein
MVSKIKSPQSGNRAAWAAESYRATEEHSEAIPLLEIRRAGGRAVAFQMRLFTRSLQQSRAMDWGFSV